MTPPDRSRLKVLHVGDVKTGKAPERLRTLLGSCVAITLWHEPSKQGGMCHYLLPEKESDEDPWVLNGRYAEDAFLLLGEQFAVLGIALGELEAKLFGGGRMLPKSTKTSSTVRLGVGQKNIDRGIELLQHYDVNLVASHHGSIGHRQIEFDLASGEVEVYFSETKMTVTV